MEKPKGPQPAMLALTKYNQEALPCFPADVFAGTETGLPFFLRRKMQYPDVLMLRVRNLEHVDKYFHGAIVGTWEREIDPHEGHERCSCGKCRCQCDNPVSRHAK